MSHVCVGEYAKCRKVSPRKISNILYSNDFPRDEAPIVAGRRMLSPAAVAWLNDYLDKAAGVFPAESVS